MPMRRSRSPSIVHHTKDAIPVSPKFKKTCASLHGPVSQREWIANHSEHHTGDGAEDEISSAPGSFHVLDLPATRQGVHLTVKAVSLDSIVSSTGLSLSLTPGIASTFVTRSLIWPM